MSSSKRNQASRLPDIENGFLNMRPLRPKLSEAGLNYDLSINSWTTRISAILRRGDLDAFLAGECRAENVIKSEQIISPKLLEKAVIKGYETDWMSRWGVAHWHPFRSRAGYGNRYDHLAEQNIAVDVKADSRDVIFIDYNEVLYQLRGNKWRPTFMKISYEYLDDKYDILCPVKYINFPIEQKNIISYLQPITGYTLFYENGKYFIGYVVCEIIEGECAKCEIVLRDKTNFLDTKLEMMGGVYLPLRFFSAIFGAFFAYDDFSRVVTLDADVEFFRYA